MAKRLTATLLVAILAVAMAACGGSGDDAGTTGDDGSDLVVSAASSLTDAFTTYGRSFGGSAVRFQFAGSDDLAAQIRQGVKPDVFAAASPRFPDQLQAEGLVGRPVVFATNRLVLAVPQDSRIHSLADLAKPGTTIAIGSPEVPIGSYTRDVLARLGSAESRAVLANVRSEEPDVKGIVGKLAQGAVDAGFVYATDVATADAEIRGIALPARLQPQVVYEAAVLTDAPHPQAARRFVDGLLEGDAQTALKEAGFGAPQTAEKG